MACRERQLALAGLVLLEALSSSEDDDLIQPPKKRRMWMRPHLRKHREQGCYENLMCELALEDAESYRSWIRMDTATFEELLGKFRRAHNTVSKIVHEVCIAIYEVLAPDFIKIQEDVDHCYQWPSPICNARFYLRFSVSTSTISATVHAFAARATSRLKIASRISSCDLRAHIDRGSAGFPEPAQLPNSSKVAPFVIIGDEGFGLKPHLLRPFPAAELKDPETMFNYRLSRGRRIVENSFGILRNRFQVYGHPLRQKPHRAVKVVQYAVAHGEKDVNDKVVFPVQRIGGKPSTDAKAVRTVFKDYFWDEGQVSWQWKLLK
ncbi:hypothetical protein HPB47_003270 [Ixodes persulcatus]|uniref:Uncharacterized protein n=1 Tax=Ixodes persulcatus TaxID=34615 RepID=A0AC60PJ29_IXOPE|nr:hypothetical protein HPB47_003270 [Ixodes persulcatus]